MEYVLCIIFLMGLVIKIFVLNCILGLFEFNWFNLFVEKFY